MGNTYRSRLCLFDESDQSDTATDSRQLSPSAGPKPRSNCVMLSDRGFQSRTCDPLWVRSHARTLWTLAVLVANTDRNEMKPISRQ